MTLPGTDDEFETYLKRRTVLPNGMSDHDKLEPPKALDAIVLQEAREAIHAQQRLDRAPRWARPVALAATILLCLSILLNVSLNTHRPKENLRQMTASTAGTRSATATSPAGEGERREKAADGTSSREAILPEAKVVEPRAPRPQVLAEANTPDQLAKLSRTPAQAPAETDSAVAATEMERSVAGTGAVESPAAAARAQAPLTAASKVAPSPPATASAGPPPSAPAPTTASRSDSARPSPSAVPSAAGPPHPRDPKTWLQQIAALRAAGKTALADAEMLRFRTAFPGYPAKPDPSAASEPPK